MIVAGFMLPIYGWISDNYGLLARFVVALGILYHGDIDAVGVALAASVDYG